MLFQPSNISPSTLSGLGAGTVDVNDGILVSWQVNGDTPMTAYEIKIFQNDSVSTQLFDTGKTTLGTPFQTHDRFGNPQFFSVGIGAPALADAGVVNGYSNGYKLLITQWWSANDYVEQSSASVFITRATPTLSINAITATSMSTTITASYSQAQGDPVSTVEWVFTVAGSESTPIKQTGAISTQMLSFDADGLMDGATYSIECNVTTASGVYVSTGFVQFTVSYPSTDKTLSYVMGQVKGSSGIYLSWSPLASSGITGYEVYRNEDGYYMEHVASVSQDTRELIDYSVGSKKTVRYIVVAVNGGVPVYVGETNYISPVFWDHSILLCYLGDDGNYHVNSEFRFSLGVETGPMSNGNEPVMQTNFTPYPSRQPTTSLYKSGTLKGYIGSATGLNRYTDSLSLQDAIYAISTSRLTKFYKNRKGDVLVVETNAAISMETGDNSPEQPMFATIGWAEVAEFKNISVVSTPTDSFWPMTGDKQVYTIVFRIENSTGELMVETSDSVGDAVTFAVDEDTGELMVTEEENFYAMYEFAVRESDGSMRVINKN